MTVNHEINNPLSAIMGSAELLLMKLQDADEDVKKKLRTIQEQATRIKEQLRKFQYMKEAPSTTYVDGTRMIDIEKINTPSPAEE